MHPGATEPPRNIGVAIEQNSRTVRSSQRKKLLREPREFLLVEGFFAQLDERNVPVDGAPRTRKKRADIEILRHGDRINRRQLERMQYDRVGGQQRRDVE